MSRSCPPPAAYKRFAAGKTLMPAEFTSAEQMKSPRGVPTEPAPWGARGVILAGCLINYYAG